MSHNISREDAKHCVGAGWGGLIDEIYDRLSPDTYITQVKEKWGGLRFYVASEAEAVLDFIDDAETRSFEICEICGKPGSPRRDFGWVKTLCEEHASRDVCLAAR